MHVCKEMSRMSPIVILRAANTGMVLTFVLFLSAVLLTYVTEIDIPLFTTVLLHLSQIIMAGLFKVAYVVRIVSLKELGYEVR